MQKSYKSDHDAITALIISFDNFKEQDTKDKALIRSDIQKLGDTTIQRVSSCENSLDRMKEEKSALETVAREIDKKVEKLMVTVYGPNQDGKGGGSEKIILLGDSFEDISRSISRIWVVVGWFIGVSFTFAGGLLYLFIDHIKHS
jgi:hypothetical protein